LIVNSPRNYLLIFFVLATLGGAALAWNQHLELIKLRAELQEKDLDAQLHQHQLEGKLAALRAGASAKAAASADEAQQNPGDDQNARFAAMRALRNNPEFLKLLALQQKAQLNNSYAPLFKQLAQQLNLSPAQIAAFQNLLVQKQDAARDVLSAARDQGLDPRTDRAAITQLMTQSNAEIDSQIQSTLGDAAFAQYQAYEQTLPQRNTVNQVAQSLSFTNSPLSDSQAQQLIQVMADNSNQNTFNPTSFRALLTGTTPSSPITDAEITQASSFLSPDQIAALQQEQQAQRAQAEIQRQLRAAAQGTAPAPAGTAATTTR
jgi:hypothetical protein